MIAAVLANGTSLFAVAIRNWVLIQCERVLVLLLESKEMKLIDRPIRKRFALKARFLENGKINTAKTARAPQIAPKNAPLEKIPHENRQEKLISFKTYRKTYNQNENPRAQSNAPPEQNIIC